MLEMLQKYRGKKVKVTLNDGRFLLCKPYTNLEEEYESFVVEVYETAGGFAKDMLVELTEDQIKSVTLV